MTSDTQTTANRQSSEALLAFLGEERERRCQALMDEAKTRVRDIETACEEQKARLLAAGRRPFTALRRTASLAVAGPARREVEAVASRKMGAAVETILAGCRERLREFAGTSVFSAVFESLLQEALEGARDQLRVDGLRDVAGTVRVAAGDEALCRRLLADLGSPLEVRVDDEVWGGAVLDLADGKYCLRNTLDSRMARQDHDLRMIATTRIHYGLSKRLDGVSQKMQEQLANPTREGLTPGAGDT